MYNLGSMYAGYVMPSCSLLSLSFSRLPLTPCPLDGVPTFEAGLAGLYTSRIG
jgi:hypothetical protein